MYQVGPGIILDNLSNSLSCKLLKSVVITLTTHHIGVCMRQRDFCAESN